MKAYILFLIPALMISGGVHAAVSCSRANLTRCLDSVCAINASSNASARCQYCGTSGAGTPPRNAMRSVSVGSSTKYNISDKELKSAPSDPGQRYAWATNQCIKKVSGCTPDDVSETYDSLIEQSCRAAGVSAQLNRTLESSSREQTKTTCMSTIQLCMISDARCMSDYRNCESDSDFDNFFSGCAVESTGCDNHISSVRADLISERDNAIKNAEKMLAQTVETYTAAREKKLTNIKNGCSNNAARDACVETVCRNNMRNGCGDGNESERSMAVQLCQFYQVACQTIN